MAGDHDDSVLLDELATHCHVVEILDLLSESGCNTALLMRFVPAQGPDLESALRLIAAHGLLATDDHGSWDEPLTIPGPLRLTDRGEAVAQALSNVEAGSTPHGGDRHTAHRSVLERAAGRVLSLRRTRASGLAATSRA
ncbi:hypothetical protein ACIRRA_11325 [Nocardia sp. NPDC101769]|uniref:hypothetical protein n=1 Tax=Nocardia sp. NPDC101769 TaxID=3364333 RepID=UPI0037FF70CA